MKTIEQLRLQPRLVITDTSIDGGKEWASLSSTRKTQQAFIVFSWGGGWDHVSVSFNNRVPTWDEMAEVKRMFFHDNETVIQFHPRTEEYVNYHPNCLHLWRSQEREAELPPWWMIGLKPGTTKQDALKEAVPYLKQCDKKLEAWEAVMEWLDSEYHPTGNYNTYTWLKDQMFLLDPSPHPKEKAYLNKGGTV